MAGRARYQRVLATDAEDAIDRARRLGGAADAQRIRVRANRNGSYSVAFVTPAKAGPAYPKPLHKKRCPLCGHLLEDHYSGYCSEWGCDPCR